MTADRLMHRVAFYTGNHRAGDGIGRALRAKIDALQQHASGHEWRVTVFCQASGVNEPDVRVVSSIASLVRNPDFQSADLHVFEFGWFYELMDALLLIPPASRGLVHFHGVTPLELVKDKSGYWATWKQQLVLHKADLVLCSSPYARQLLLQVGLSPKRLRRLPLPATVVPERPPVKAVSGPIELLQVCRLVPHKGTLDLVHALALLPPELRKRMRLRVAGEASGDFQDYRAEIAGVIAASGLQTTVEFLGPVIDDRQLSELYAGSDALVIPSYHDSFCLPLIEAYAHGCHVIAYDNSNLQHAAANLGRIVPTGKIADLSRAIADFAEALGAAGRHDGSVPIATDSGPIPWGSLQEQTRRQARQFSQAQFARSFRDLATDLLRTPGTTRMERVDAAAVFGDARSFLVRPRDLALKAPFGEPGLELMRNGRLEYERARFGSVGQNLLFYGPYIDLFAGRWKVELDAVIKGEFTVRLTHNFGTIIKEQVISDRDSTIQFELNEDIAKFETLLFCSARSFSISLGSLSVQRMDLTPREAPGHHTDGSRQCS